MLPDQEQPRLRKETLLHRLPTVYTPEAFDRLFVERPGRQDTIAGFSTVSLTQAMKGLRRSSFAVEPWSDQTETHVNVDLHGSVLDHVYKKIDKRYSSSESLFDNRVYGVDWINCEIYQEIEQSRSIDYPSV